ncbi:MAG: hypothetical protein CBB87_08200 [Micavibrio sp. TMED27]|nr:hypothetical protein [Micavibrio sp.]OUT90652.1 MAG: hypothetical protein CBB87_08200 [Micavibrio sp. TMED27]
MIFNEKLISKNLELASLNLKERRRDLLSQLERIRELKSEIDRLDDLCLSTDHKIAALKTSIRFFNQKKRQYRKAQQIHKRWKIRTRLFCEFKNAYEIAGSEVFA